MKYLTILLVALLLSACDPETTPAERKFDIPKELSDCKFFRMKDTIGNVVLVVRCPLSATSATMTGKHATYSTTIDSTL